MTQKIKAKKLKKAKKTLTKSDFVNAAKYINKNGLERGYFGGLNNGPACALGAIRVVTGKHSSLIFLEVFKNTFGHPDFCIPDSTRLDWLDIASFNDHPKTTKEDVETLLLLIGEMLPTLAK